MNYIPYAGINLILLIVLVFNPGKLREQLPLHFVSGRFCMFSVSGFMLETYFKVAAKTGNKR